MNSSISLCMVVKNEAEYLEDCLKHLLPWVREMIVVDTGSTDETPSIAERCGARVFFFPWNNDFSSARNFSLRQANEPWILVLDADERLALCEAEKLSSLVQGASTPAAFSFLQRNYLNGSGQLTWDQSWQANTHQYEEGRGIRRLHRYCGCPSVSPSSTDWIPRLRSRKHRSRFGRQRHTP